MKNKTSKKKKGFQIGNFLVTYDNGEMKAVKVTSVYGNWNVRYREDSMLYIWISKEINSEEGRKVLELAFSCWYAATNGIPDVQFLEDVVQAYKRSIDRMKEGIETLSDSEDQKITDELKNDFNSR